MPAFFIFASVFWNWMHRLGGLGLILLGIVDNSFIPVPGSVDAFTVVLSAHKQEWWWYYAMMATIGAVVGGYLTFRIGRKGGEKTLEKRIPRRKARRVYAIFSKFGFWAVALPALLPPPVPMVPFLLTAGAMKYRKRKFLSALMLGRSVRYTTEAYVGRIYSRQIFAFFGKYYKPILYTLTVLAAVGGIVALVLLLRRRRKQRGQRQPKRLKKVA